MFADKHNNMLMCIHACVRVRTCMDSMRYLGILREDQDAEEVGMDISRHNGEVRVCVCAH